MLSKTPDATNPFWNFFGAVTLLVCLVVAVEAPDTTDHIKGAKPSSVAPFLNVPLSAGRIRSHMLSQPKTLTKQPASQTKRSFSLMLASMCAPMPKLRARFCASPCALSWTKTANSAKSSMAQPPRGLGLGALAVEASDVGACAAEGLRATGRSKRSSCIRCFVNWASSCTSSGWSLKPRQPARNASRATKVSPSAKTCDLPKMLAYVRPTASACGRWSIKTVSRTCGNTVERKVSKSKSHVSDSSMQASTAESTACGSRAPQTPRPSVARHMRRGPAPPSGGALPLIIRSGPLPELYSANASSKERRSPAMLADSRSICLRSLIAFRRAFSSFRIRESFNFSTGQVSSRVSAAPSPSCPS
mmetsp:Transcript_42056/g.121992  ORF Transcript_42056/g.121992 Transcript_42056/m.121992 type:complete len:361 (-) Transcript_42056:675-1757(-)